MNISRSILNSSNNNRNNDNSSQVPSHLTHISRSFSMDDAGATRQEQQQQHQQQIDYQQNQSQYLVDNDDVQSTTSLRTRTSHVTDQQDLVGFGQSRCREFENNEEYQRKVWDNPRWANCAEAKDLARYMLKHNSIRDWVTDATVLEHLLGSMSSC